MPKLLSAVLLIFALYLGGGAMAAVTAVTHIHRSIEVQNAQAD